MARLCRMCLECSNLYTEEKDHFFKLSYEIWQHVLTQNVCWVGSRTKTLLLIWKNWFAFIRGASYIWSSSEMIRKKRYEKQSYTVKFQSLHCLFFFPIYVMTRILQDQSYALVLLLIIVFIFGSSSSRVIELFPLLPYEKWNLNLYIWKIAPCKVPVLLSHYTVALQTSITDVKWGFPQLSPGFGPDPKTRQWIS